MENKAIKWLLAIIAVALLVNAAVSFRPYQLVVGPASESYRLNVYTGRVSAVIYDVQETKKFLPFEPSN